MIKIDEIEQFEKESLPQIKHQFWQLNSKTFPKEMDQFVTELKEKFADVFGILEVATRAIDGNVHNVMFNISINGQIVMGNIHFPAPYVKRLAVVAKEMMDSIEFIEDAKEA